MTFASLIAFAAEEAEHSGNAMLETLWFPIVAIAVFTFLGIVTLSHRNVSNRHAHKAEAYAREHAVDVQQNGHGH
ncbi:hypothetical protein GH740_11360 [Microbacterium sp. SYP-A9085]|jgi:hypothetical protein|uniref:hypothetical protein n=1 Tax=Microbacterium sp. SYP-A9085 TaxID=2664454 RepID=UPI00129BE0CE|nr:hypothetical protein [Microbacterium sp. SYP-A9085]MRH29901.1 hypothetical protein [Microbacterium sp. SYP-A9085]